MKFAKQGLENTKVWKQICGDLLPCEEINHIYKTNALTPCEMKFLACSVKYELPNITERFEIYRVIPYNERKANSIYLYHLKYGKEIGNKLYYEKNKKCKHTLENFAKRYGEEEGLKRYTEHNSKKKETLENFIRRYGAVEGTKRYNEFCERNKGNMSLERLQELYGEEEGTQRHKDIRDFFKFNSSLEGYVIRFGEELGQEKFYERMNKMKNGVRRNTSGRSASSQKLFKEIFNCIKNDYEEIFFDTLNTEFGVKQYFLDFYVKDVNRCIEFNGDSFHANPLIYKPDDKPHPYLKDIKAKELWAYDKKRLAEIENKGIMVLTVWEKEFRTEPTNTIQKCINFINGKQI